MKISAYLIGDSPVSLWSLTARERLQKQLESLGITLREALPEAANSTGDKWLLVRCDYLFELRTFKCLLEKETFLLEDDSERDVVAALVNPDRAHSVATLMQDQFCCRPTSDVMDLPTGIRTDLSVYDDRLRRAEPPLLEKLSEDRAAALEDLLYGNAYKGVTDLVTKWAWPRPAKKLVHFCAAKGYTPNQVTATGLVLVIIAGFCFYYGLFGLGLLAGWIMTLLDTVDGKLARVRIQSSKIGNLFDHGIDLIHPPFWYLAWAAGLERLGLDISVTLAAYLIFIGYIAGRLAELSFEKLCGGSIFVWRPFDSWFRLVTARRNPCMIILTLSLIIGGPLAGLWAVVWWTLGTTMVLWLRVFQGLKARRALGEKLPSWLADPKAAERYPISHPVFSKTQGAYRA